jgi:hypothetical protein
VHNKLALEEKEARSSEFLCGEVFLDVISASDERLMRFSHIFLENFSRKTLQLRCCGLVVGLINRRFFCSPSPFFLSLLPSPRSSSINKFAHH